MSALVHRDRKDQRRNFGWGSAENGDEGDNEGEEKSLVAGISLQNSERSPAQNQPLTRHVTWPVLRRAHADQLGLRRVLAAPHRVVLGMDSNPPVTGTYPADPRLPLLTTDEAREAVSLLRHFADDSAEGQAAGDLATDLARRLPAE